MSGKSRTTEQVASIAHRHYRQDFTGTAATEYPLAHTVLRIEDVLVYVSGALKVPADRGTAHDYSVRGLTAGYAGDSNMIKFAAAPNGLAVTFLLVGG